MTVLQDNPDELRSLVYDVVADGAWTTADVIASVAADFAVDRADVVATLWDLVDEGALRYDCCASFPGFRLLAAFLRLPLSRPWLRLS